MITMFNARVHGMWAEDGKLVFDVDVDGQKSAPWSYKEFPKREDLWGMSIHTSGEEGDRISAAITAYGDANAGDKAALFATARTQTISVATNGSCLRCANALKELNPIEPTQCPACEAWYKQHPEARVCP